MILRIETYKYYITCHSVLYTSFYIYGFLLIYFEQFALEVHDRDIQINKPITLIEDILSKVLKIVFLSIFQALPGHYYLCLSKLIIFLH